MNCISSFDVNCVNVNKGKNNSRKRIEATEEHVKFSIRDLSEKGYIFVIFNRNFIQKIKKKKQQLSLVWFISHIWKHLVVR